MEKQCGLRNYLAASILIVCIAPSRASEIACILFSILKLSSFSRLLIFTRFERFKNNLCRGVVRTSKGRLDLKKKNYSYL